MKAVIQRVLCAELRIDGECISKIDKGLLVYLGFCVEDTKQKVEHILDRVAKMRIFEDANGKINLDLSAVQGKVMLVPNFTLYADAEHGRRPSFSAAAPGDFAKELFEYSLQLFEQNYFKPSAGVFGADMKISSIADGPINILLEY